MTVTAAPARHRLFFAFWPDEALRAAIARSTQSLFPLAGRPVSPPNLHVTAAFLGAVAEERVAALRALAGPVAPFPLTFDRIEHWPKPRVLAAVASRPPPALQVLIDGLWSRLDRLGFARESRPYRAHLTLAREVRMLRAGTNWQALEWPVTELRLVESRSTPAGVAYELIDGPGVLRSGGSA
ncbi:MAG: RNA 2',3'-cyclic phosphodiesterase [Steroidobacteraceae bacterium]